MLSRKAMKPQILDKITFLGLPNSFEMCNCSPEGHAHTKCTYLQMRSSLWEIYFFKKLGRGRTETHWKFPLTGSEFTLQSVQHTENQLGVNSLFYKLSE